MPLILIILAILLSGCGLSSALREAKDDVSCRTADGGSVEGSVDIRHCH